MLTVDDLRPRVDRGARLLDYARPGWADRAGKSRWFVHGGILGAWAFLHEFAGLIQAMELSRVAVVDNGMGLGPDEVAEFPSHADSLVPLLATWREAIELRLSLES
jgi:hypothetical protein